MHHETEGAEAQAMEVESGNGEALLAGLRLDEGAGAASTPATELSDEDKQTILRCVWGPSM